MSLLFFHKMSLRLKTLISKPPLLFLLTSLILLLSLVIVVFTLTPIPLSPSSNYALSFDNGDYVEVPSSKSLNIDGSLTVQLWVNSFESGNARLLTKGNYFEGNYFISWRNDGYIEFFVTNNETGEWKLNQILVPAFEFNKWYYITFIYDKDAGVMQGYVNGKITAEKSVGSFRLRTGAWAVTIGKGEDNTPFHGLISDILIFNRVLTPAEIREDMRGNITISEGLVGWWKFGEGNENRTVDSSTYHNDGVIYGAKWSRLDKIDLYLNTLFTNNAARVLLPAGVSFLSIGVPWTIAEFSGIHNRSFGRLVNKPRIRRIIVRFKENPSSVPILLFMMSLVIVSAESVYDRYISDAILSYTLCFLLIGVLMRFIEFVLSTRAGAK